MRLDDQQWSNWRREERPRVERHVTPILRVRRKEGPAKEAEKQQRVKYKGNEGSLGSLKPSEEHSSSKRTCVKCY